MADEPIRFKGYNIQTSKNNPVNSNAPVVETTTDGTAISDNETQSNLNNQIDAKIISETPNESEMLLHGIYGYISDADNGGERVLLSLTPYEQAGRLSDPGFKTIGERLKAATVYTNFMQEVLSSDSGDEETLLSDPRFTSKDDRIGFLSRFLSETGEEADKSTFMHIVPDVEATGGKIPITYAKYAPDGTRSTENGVAYVPVNFNFTSSQYTLTIKEFIIENVSEANREIYSLVKSFDGFSLRFFGQNPKIISFSGLLTNFDDDTIGFGKAVSQSKGSQRDVFLSYYKNFLAGTKCRDYMMKVYFYYNHKIVEGYLVEMSVNTSSSNDNVVSFGGNMIIRREYTTFEAGRGLGQGIKSLANLQRGIIDSNSGKDFLGSSGGVFNSEKSYRLSYRAFALKSYQSKVQEETRSGVNNTESNVGASASSEEINWMDSGFNKTNESDIELLNVWISVIHSTISSVVGYKPKLTASLISSRFQSRKHIKFLDFIDFIISDPDFFYPKPNLLETASSIFDALVSKYTLSSLDKEIVIRGSKGREKLIEGSLLFKACYKYYFNNK